MGGRERDRKIERGGNKREGKGERQRAAPSEEWRRGGAGSKGAKGKLALAGREEDWELAEFVY